VNPTHRAEPGITWSAQPASTPPPPSIYEAALQSASRKAYIVRYCFSAYDPNRQARHKRVKSPPYHPKGSKTISSSVPGRTWRSKREQRTGMRAARQPFDISGDRPSCADGPRRSRFLGYDLTPSSKVILLFKGGAKGRSGFPLRKTTHREGIRHLIPWYLKVYPKTKGRDSPAPVRAHSAAAPENPGETANTVFAPSAQRASSRRAFVRRANGSQRPVFLWNPPSNPLHHLDSDCQQTTR
jgi:hypothetical protein